MPSFLHRFLKFSHRISGMIWIERFHLKQSIFYLVNLLSYLLNWSSDHWSIWIFQYLRINPISLSKAIRRQLQSWWFIKSNRKVALVLWVIFVFYGKQKKITPIWICTIGHFNSTSRFSNMFMRPISNWIESGRQWFNHDHIKALGSSLVL